MRAHSHTYAHVSVTGINRARLVQLLIALALIAAASWYWCYYKEAGGVRVAPTDENTPVATVAEGGGEGDGPEQADRKVPPLRE